MMDTKQILYIMGKSVAVKSSIYLEVEYALELRDRYEAALKELYVQYSGRGPVTMPRLPNVIIEEALGMGNREVLIVQPVELVVTEKTDTVPNPVITKEST